MFFYTEQTTATLKCKKNETTVVYCELGAIKCQRGIADTATGVP